jgi:DNA-binding transcriptional LysR family regulator
VGNLPRHAAESAAAAGRLVIKRTQEPKVSQQLFLAWRSAHKGKALQWMVKRLAEKAWLERALQIAD